MDREGGGITRRGVPNNFPGNDDDDDDDPHDKWAKRFVAAAIIQGAIIVGLTIFLVVSEMSILKPDVARVIAGGGVGTWFTFGYLVYIVVGVIGVAVSSVFYHYLGQGYGLFGRASNMLAWVHLILMNVGVTAASAMMMFAGYQGGAAMLPPAVGGQGLSANQVHQIIAPYVEPIGGSILVLMAGVIAGGVAFLLAYRAQTTRKKKVVDQSRTTTDTESAA